MRSDQAPAVTPEARLQRYLGFGAAQVERAAQDGTLLLRAPGRSPMAVAADLLARLVKQGLVVRAKGGVALSAPSGQGLLARPEIRAELRETPDGIAQVLVDGAESPLAAMQRRKCRSGLPFLAAAEFQAGEKLRADYTRACIMPRLGANWEASVASGRRQAGGLADLTETSIAARMRVERALDAVGPELSGLLVDVCCFLKGLETVEAERMLPPRSAKMLLKAALGILARHYHPPAEKRRAGHHWGAEGYRPSIIAPAGAQG